MVNLTKKALALAGTAIAFAGMAFGQATCTPGGPQAIIRAEGTTEQLPKIVLTCSVANPASSIAGSGTLQLFMAGSTGAPTVTSKVVDTATGDTEIVATINGGSTYFLGKVSGTTISFTFSAGSFPALTPTGPAGTVASFTIEIQNIRVNASALPAATGTPASISYSGFLSGSVGSVNPTALASTTSAYAQPGFASVSLYKAFTGSTTFPNGTVDTSKTGSNSFALCTAYSPVKDSVDLLGANAAKDSLVTVVRVSENFTSAFKSTAGEKSAVDIATGTGNTVSHGTRIQLTFGNIPSGVTLYVPTGVLKSSGAARAQLTSAAAGQAFVEVPPSSDTANVQTTGKGGPLAAVSNGVATFEITTPDDNVLDKFDIPVFIVAKANSIPTGSPALTITAGFGPTGASTIPNFAAGTNAIASSSFSACSTNLLFPFVTSQLGFDTGLAIANTSSDPFGTSNGATSKQDGTCTLTFYGDNGTSTPSAPFTTDKPVLSGATWTALLSQVAPGFQGYIMAKCNFNYAHGFAYINYGFGQNNGLSLGYLANVIAGSRPTNEGLGQ